MTSMSVGLPVITSLGDAAVDGTTSLGPRKSFLRRPGLQVP